MEAIYGIYRTVTSRPAQKAYIKTLLFGLATLVLLAFAATSYIILYMNYIPPKGLSRVVHLQHSTSPNVNPTGAISLDTLVPFQDYTITATLTLPTTPRNLDIGNFMVLLSLYKTPEPPSSALSDHWLLARSQRPAILTYHSPLLLTLQALLHMPFYLTGFSREEETLTIPLFESISFSDAPKSGRIEIFAGNIGVYDLHLEFYANFSGLRWAMYSHRILSFIFFTGTFFTISLLFTGITFHVISSRFPSIRGTDETSSTTSEERSEDTRRFTYARAPASRSYPSPSPTPDAEGMMTPESGMSVAGTVVGEDADDELEEEAGPVDVGDSGLGTFSESTGRAAAGGARRRMHGAGGR